LLRWFGVLCLVAAAGIAGYLGWLLWGTGLATQRAQAEIEKTFPETLNTETPEQASEHPIPLGNAYAEIQIPSIGVDFFVVQGVTLEDLRKGPGHYPDSADPWQNSGAVGIAGHRTTYLHPFFHLDDMKNGDKIMLRTKAGTYTYSVTEVKVYPTAGSGVVLEQTQKPTLVLTTCNPIYSDSQRLVVFADRVSGP